MTLNKTIAIIALLIIAAIFWFTASSPQKSTTKRYPDVPWIVSFPTENTIKVLGVTIGQDTVENVKATFKSDYKLGLYVDKNDNASLEAYFNSVKQAGLSAKVVLHLDINNQPWQQWQKNQARVKSLPNGEKKYSLSAKDFRKAQLLPIKLMAYIPVVNLDEEVINKRFGTDHEKIQISKTVTYWLYPTKGMAIRLDTKGKEIITYAHPSNIHLLKKAIDEEVAENRVKTP